MRFTIRCKQLREISTSDGMPVTMTADSRAEEKRYVEASFEQHDFKNNVNYYLSVPVELLDDSIKIGDEYEVLIAKKLN